jgi:hypothetical protein
MSVPMPDRALHRRPALRFIIHGSRSFQLRSTPAYWAVAILVVRPWTMNTSITFSFRPSRWTSYAAWVGMVTACAIATAFAMWSFPDERPLLIILGAPTVLYFEIARHLGLGLPLLTCTFLAYFALMFAPPFFFGCTSKRRFWLFIACVTFIHVVLGLTIAFAVHGVGL